MIKRRFLYDFRKNDKRISSKILYFEKKYGKIEKERSMRRGFLAAIFKNGKAARGKDKIVCKSQSHAGNYGR